MYIHIDTYIYIYIERERCICIYQRTRWQLHVAPAPLKDMRACNILRVVIPTLKYNNVELIHQCKNDKPKILQGCVLPVQPVIWFRGNHLSNTTCLTHAVLKHGE